VAYILLGLFMEETSSRSKSLFEGLGIWFREFTQKVADFYTDTFGNGRSSHRDR
jgi:hypothetical protein